MNSLGWEMGNVERRKTSGGELCTGMAINRKY